MYNGARWLLSRASEVHSSDNDAYLFINKDEDESFDAAEDEEFEEKDNENGFLWRADTTKEMASIYTEFLSSRLKNDEWNFMNELCVRST